MRCHRMHEYFATCQDRGHSDTLLEARRTWRKCQVGLRLVRPRSNNDTSETTPETQPMKRTISFFVLGTALLALSVRIITTHKTVRETDRIQRVENDLTD